MRQEACHGSNRCLLRLHPIGAQPFICSLLFGGYSFDTTRPKYVPSCPCPRSLIARRMRVCTNTSRNQPSNQQSIDSKLWLHRSHARHPARKDGSVNSSPLTPIPTKLTITRDFHNPNLHLPTLIPFPNLHPPDDRSLHPLHPRRPFGPLFRTTPPCPWRKRQPHNPPPFLASRSYIFHKRYLIQHHRARSLLQRPHAPRRRYPARLRLLSFRARRRIYGPGRG